MMFGLDSLLSCFIGKECRVDTAITDEYGVLKEVKDAGILLETKKGIMFISASHIQKITENK